MRFLTTSIRLAVFLALLAFAVKNDGMVTVKAFFDLSWQVPLLVVMLGMFAAGVIVTLLAMAFSSQSLRRENHRLRKLLPQSLPSTLVADHSADTKD